MHWIATALVRGSVIIYDSCFDGKLAPSIELQIAQLYKPVISKDCLLVSVASIQQTQHGSNACGLWAIAAAYHTALGDDIGELTINDEKMRSHLIRCFTSQKLRRFPKTKDTGSERPKTILSSRNQHMLPMSLLGRYDIV